MCRMGHRAIHMYIMISQRPKGNADKVESLHMHKRKEKFGALLQAHTSVLLAVMRVEI